MQKTFLLFAPWLVSGGADRCSLDLCQFFKAQGWRVVVVITREHKDGNVWRYKFDALCDEVIDLGHAWRSGSVSSRIRDIVTRLRPRVCLVNNAHEGYDVSRMLHEILPDCLITCLLHMNLPGAWDFPGQLVQGQHRWFHKILTVSQRLADELAHRGVPGEKLAAVPWYGYEKEPEPEAQSTMRQVVRQELGLNPHQFTVLFPMRLTEQKQPMLIPKIVKLMLHHGGNPAFVVVGDGPLGTRMKKQVEKDGTAGKFRFLGPVDPANMDALYAAADALCLPSADEGIPLVYFEAMQSGVPCVGSDVGAVSELIKANRTGILIPKGAHTEPKNYAEALHWIMTNRDQGKKLADQARTYVGQHFSLANWQAHVSAALNDAGLPARPLLEVRTAPVNKVFVIGAPRTGTTSVGRALSILGFRDYGHDPYLQELFNHGCYEPIWERVGMHDSFSDGPFNTGDFYRVLAERYPQARFILTVRDKQKWKESHRRHFDPAFPNRDVKDRFKLHRYEPEIWWRWYDRRNAQIRAFFQETNRPHHLLELNIGEDCNQWEKLIGFLGPEARVPSPLPEFPWVNKFQP